MPGHRLKIDAADDRTRARQVIGDSAGKIESVVGDERHVEIAADRAQERRIVLFAVPWISAGLVMLVGNNASPEFLRRMLEGCRRGGVGGRGTFENQKIAPFARHDELHKPIHELRAARIDVHELGGT